MATGPGSTLPGPDQTEMCPCLGGHNNNLDRVIDDLQMTG
jgi:hypothetical protein